jgi:hypothetical protein
MSSSVITAQQLRALREERRKSDLRNTVNMIANEYVIPAAESGKTSVLVKEEAYNSKYPRIGYNIASPPPFADLVEALRSKFPDIVVAAGSDTTINQSGIFVKKTHILFDWSIPPEPPAPTKGCREMSKCFTDGQRIRHTILRNNQTLYATYDAQSDRLVLDDGKTFGGPCGVANEHYRRYGFAHGHRDGWGECECEVNGKWVSTYSLPG